MTVREFNYSQAQLGAWLRYVIVGLVALFIGAMPMPVDKTFLTWLCVADGLANFAYHVCISVTRRSGVATYVMSSFEMLLMMAGIYKTGFLVSPFLPLLPLHFFTVYFAAFNPRVTVAFGVAVLALMAALFTVWLFVGSTMPEWAPHGYVPFALLLFALQMFAMGSYLYLSVQTNPFLAEIHKQQHALEVQQNRAELGTAMAMVTHEVRTPLSTAYATLDNAITQLSSARRKPDVAKALQELTVTFEQLKRLDAMLESTLSFTRDKRGRLLKSDHRLRDVIERALGFITLKYGRHAVTHQVFVEVPARQTIHCDADAMHQVLVNLIDNAIQHPQKGRRMRLEFSAATRTDGWQVFSIRDNGRGLPDERKENVFVQYVSGREGGTGLGLAIVHHLIKNHGGEIVVHSQEGIGTTFTILLPPPGVPEAALAAQPATAPRPAGGA